jgi:hypothetical protein
MDKITTYLADVEIAPNVTDKQLDTISADITSATCTSSAEDDMHSNISSIPAAILPSTASSGSLSLLVSPISSCQMQDGKPFHAVEYRYTPSHHWTKSTLKNTQKHTASTQNPLQRVLHTPRLFAVPSHHDKDQRWRGGRGQAERLRAIALLPRSSQRYLVRRPTTWKKGEAVRMLIQEQQQFSSSTECLDAKKPVDALASWPKATFPKISPPLSLPPFKWEALDAQSIMTPTNLDAPPRTTADHAITMLEIGSHPVTSSDSASRFNPTSQIAPPPRALLSDDRSTLVLEADVSSDTHHHSLFPLSHRLTSSMRSHSISEMVMASSQTFALAEERARIHYELLQYHLNQRSWISSRSDFTGFYTVPSSLANSQLESFIPVPVTGRVYMRRPLFSCRLHLGSFLFWTGFIFPPCWLIGALYLPWPDTERTFVDYRWRHRCRVIVTLAAGLGFMVAIVYIFIAVV